MKLRLVRFEYGTTYTIGRLYIDDEFFCYTLEDAVREVDGVDVSKWKIKEQTAIPRGTYDVSYEYSGQPFNRKLPLLLNVPGYSGIRIHPGNTATDTEGCILVGYGWGGTDSISTSRKCSDDLNKIISEQKGEITITVE